MLKVIKIDILFKSGAAHSINVKYDVDTSIEDNNEACLDEFHDFLFKHFLDDIEKEVTTPFCFYAMTDRQYIVPGEVAGGTFRLGNA